MESRVLVWGGAGFIGCVLIRQLLECGFNVLVVDNLRKGGKSLINFIDHPNFSFEYGDIRDEKTVERVQSDTNIEAIILLSGIVGLDDCNNNVNESWQVNVDGWKNVAKHSNNIPIVSSSSGSVYGFIENELCNENTETNPVSLYAKTKLEGEKPILDVGGLVYRYATAGGVSPQIRLNLLPNTLTFEALQKGKLSIYEPDNMRTFIDVKDFGRSLIYGVQNFDVMKSLQLYNVGSETNNCSKRQLVNYIQSVTNCSVEFHDNEKDPDARSYIVDYSRIRSVGFECEFTVEDIVSSLVKTYKIWI